VFASLLSTQNYDNSVYMVNQYTVFIGMRMKLQFLKFFPWLYAGSFHYTIFYHKILGGQNLLCSPCPKFGGRKPLPFFETLSLFSSKLFWTTKKW